MSRADFAVRKSAEELLLRAAEAGIAHPERLLRCTPREIELAFLAQTANRQRRLEEIDLLAWLIGRYVTIGMHAPKRFPRRPNAVQVRKTEMTDAQMRRVFMDFAERRGKTDGSC